jgi:transposase-like protein
MNRLTKKKRTQAVASLVEGNSLRATAHICGVEVDTVMRLLEDIGRVRESYQRRALVNLPCKRI